MEKPRIPVPEQNPKELLGRARRAAASGEEKTAIALFESCIREYLRRRLPFKALAASRVARKTLGRLPKAHALLIRNLLSMNLEGDAGKEFSESCLAWSMDAASFFHKLSMEEFADLLEIMQLQSFRKGRCIMKEGGKGEDIYILISGTLEVSRGGAHLSTMHPGDVFGELGFFSRACRTATVKASSPCEVALIASQDLQVLCGRRPGLKDSLEALYHERILKKAGEDLRSNLLVDLENDILTTSLFRKGQQIPLERTGDFSIIKHGVVEVTFDDRGHHAKKFLKAGSVIGGFSGTARASTDVELIRARIDLLGTGK